MFYGLTQRAIAETTETTESDEAASGSDSEGDHNYLTVSDGSFGNESSSSSSAASPDRSRDPARSGNVFMDMW